MASHPTPALRRPSLLVTLFLSALALVVVGLLAPGCQSGGSDEEGGDPPPDTMATAGGGAGALAFRNAVNDPPADWTGPVFQLSADYPTADPGPCSVADCPWLNTSEDDFINEPGATPQTWNDSKWPAYMQTVKDYIRQGQDPNLANEVGFQTTVDGATRWFHVPWMAYNPTSGRDFIHGTTNERTSYVSDLLGPDATTQLTGGHGVNLLPGTSDDPACQSGFETWAVGVYNTYGGYALGQSWGPDGLPRTKELEGSTVPAGLPFAEGTLVTKFLFTSAPVECVPYLEGSPEWTVNRHTSTGEGSDTQFQCTREPQTVRLVQVDIAAVDNNSPTRWVYGTYAYNGRMGGATVWDNLAPVGVQWGSDPWTHPAVPQGDSNPAVQSVLNEDLVANPETGIYEHFGCEGRLAGPVDNGKSSCMSCHASAYAAADGAISSMGSNVPASFGFPGLCDQFSEENEDYFQNNIFPAAYSGGQYPTTMNLDTSMQMWVAFQQYGTYNTNGEPEACTMGS